MLTISTSSMDYLVNETSFSGKSCFLMESASRNLKIGKNTIRLQDIPKQY
jgi:hypothetical protein